MPEPLMVMILGCTACGKSRLAFELARELNGQILCVDSMKVYRRMDIGTAKPNPEALREITHHMIDIVEPYESFSLGRYIELADQAIEQIKQAGSPVIAVGGTAMYLRGLLEGIFQGPQADPDYRERLNCLADREGLEILYKQLEQADPKAVQKIHPNDRKRIIRALEVYHLTGRPISSFQSQFRSGQFRHDWRLFGIHRDKQENNRRINRRVKDMIGQGLLEEVKSLLAETRGWSPQAAQAVGYAELIDHLQGKSSLDDAVEKIKINTRRLAKNQRTWFKTFPNVQWLDACENTSVQELLRSITEAVRNPAT